MTNDRFILLAAIRGAEEYDPITDLLGVIRLILDTFLTPSQSLLYFAHTLAPATAFSAFLSAPVSRDATPDGSPTASSFSPTPPTTTSTTVNDSMNNSIPLIRALERARAKKDGPAFLAAIDRFNTVLVNLKQEGKMKENIEAMKGVAEKVWTKVVAQVYERAVGPEIERLSKYEAFSDNVYGELLPKFMMEMYLRFFPLFFSAGGDALTIFGRNVDVNKLG
jgi:H3 lysine-79-specific histone-lysine N-methyltransferase